MSHFIEATLVFQTGNSSTPVAIWEARVRKRRFARDKRSTILLTWVYHPLMHYKLEDPGDARCSTEKCRAVAMNFRSWASAACACRSRMERSMNQARSARFVMRSTTASTTWTRPGRTTRARAKSVLGKALRDGYRQKVKLATKLPSWMIKSRADMDRFLAAQLKKLGTEQIDYYLVHALNGKRWDKLERLGVLDFLDQARKDGRIVNAGFSFHGLADDFKRIVDAYPWVFCQIQYNYLDEEQPGWHGGLGIRCRTRDWA